MAGDDDAYYVPVIVSDGRETSDKCLYFIFITFATTLANFFIAGKASLVFDTIFNTSIGERVSKDLDYRTFITGTCHYPSVGMAFSFLSGYV